MKQSELQVPLAAEQKVTVLWGYHIVVSKRKICKNSVTLDSLPNIHTSLAVVNRRKFIDSGAIHLIGNRVTDADGMEEKMNIS